MATEPATPPVALVTGAARRLGAAICQALHERGYNIVVHYGHSAGAATALCDTLNRHRHDSAITVQADLRQPAQLDSLARAAVEQWGRLNCLVNNASMFFPTPLDEITEGQWDDLQGSNVKGPFFLSRALAPALTHSSGTIVNLADINGRIPLKGYPAYSIAKGGMVMLTRVLARELAPKVRVNGIAPGAILWAEGDATLDERQQEQILAKIPLGRLGQESDIANLALLLASGPGYLTGQVIAVDGGLSLAGGYD